jgi:hypothetical protein
MEMILLEENKTFLSLSSQENARIMKLSTFNFNISVL